MIYLASPFSHPDKSIEHERYETVAELYVHLIRHRNVQVFSPIVASYHIAIDFHLPATFGFWKRLNFAWLAKCEELWVYKMDGWEESKGVQSEIAIAKQLSMPICFVNKFGEHIL